jgi:hypothetical protein
MKYRIFTIFLITILGCGGNRDPISSNNAESSYGIYFLEDSSITEYDSKSIDINKLILSNEPWLKQSDIEFYDFSTHCIYLKEDKSYFFENFEGKFYQFNPVLISRPFVIVAENERCYVGALHSGLLSMAPVGPYMDELDVGFYPSDVMHISRSWSDNEDIRSDPRVVDILIKQNLFHAGLEIELTSFKLISNSDTSTVEYQIKLINNDQDNLYVIDPDKMGSALFHYYTNGPHLWDYTNSVYLYSKYKEVDSPNPYDSWKFEWFTLIERNQSIVRTIRLKGYPFIPKGNYVGYMNYSTPKRIDKENRIIAGDRIWIGDIRSNEIEINI